MTLHSLNLDAFMDSFNQLEQKIAALHTRNCQLEMMLEEAEALIKFHLNKEKSIIEERDDLLSSVKNLQQNIQEQCHLRVVNAKLKNDVAILRQQNERAEKDRQAAVQQVLAEMKVEEERHQRELDVVRQQYRRELEQAHIDLCNQLEAKNAEMQSVLEKNASDLQDMQKKIAEQEREKQSEVLKLQLEFSAKLARMQNTAQWTKQQHKQQMCNPIPLSVYKKKLNFIQEEKNREIAALRQRITELEELLGDVHDPHPKKKKL
ncbi:coiled-coil domain-containing protein 152-like [Synchiropus splendidus]|uniref:coiled-coil domain-containing protein 152-like n=1 Tax=Synchiropus splendidus TaxID=270530 RepID=UPI00237E7326|nr:coiled-coil domain-containing protein 152-like [Synchiropus splendidus]